MSKRELIVGDAPAVKPLGRHLYHDDANRDYPVRAVLPKRVVPVRKLWWRQGIYDQAGSSCTAQAASGVLVTSPFRMVASVKASLPAHDTEAERHSLYLTAQGVDPWPGGEPQYEGSSTDAPFRIARDRGWIREWRWCFGLQDVLDTLRAHGPVAVGTNWYEGMFYPSKTTGKFGISGEIAGGHAYQLIGDDPAARMLDAVNSWSYDWGRNGRFKISYAQMDRLLNEDGEAVTVVL